jgi:hypothetical protein
MVAIFLFSPPCHYTKNTYLTFPNPTTPRFFLRDRVNVNFCNKPDGIEKTFTLTSFIYLRLGAFRSGFKKEDMRKTNFVTNLYKKNAPFFSTPLTNP